MRAWWARISARFACETVQEIAPRGPAVRIPWRRDAGHAVKEERWRRRTNERATASRSLLLDSYPRSLVLICLLGFRATGQNSSCLSFSALFRLTNLSLSLSLFLCHRRPSSLSSSFSFCRPFFSLRHLASNPSLAAGTLKGLLAAPSCRKERGNSGNSSEAFSNRIPHCRLGNSRRIEITHYLVMSGAFTSTRGCTRRMATCACVLRCVHTTQQCYIYIVAARKAARLGRRANAVTSFLVP